MESLSTAGAASYLNTAIVRVAVLQARKLIAQGVAPDEAVRLACPGAWSRYRALVQARLEAAAHDRIHVPETRSDDRRSGS